MTTTTNAEHLRERAAAAMANGEREYNRSEYPNIGRSVYEQQSAALEALADAIEGNPLPDGNSYAERRQRRIVRLKLRAERLRLQSADLRVSAHHCTDGIPFGQPILVGHHSEGRHRRTLERAAARERKGWRLSEWADRVASRAHAAEKRRAIDSDDPDAPDKLRAKIAELEAAREYMKAVNAEYRKAKGDLSKCPTLKEKHRARFEVDKRDWYMGSENWRPFDSWALSNLGKNLKRYQDRLAEVEALQDMTDDDIELGGVTLSIDTRSGRVYFFTPGRSEAATKLLRGAGWCWARSITGWSRKLTANALADAKRLHPQLSQAYEVQS